MRAPAVSSLVERELRVFVKIWHASAFSAFGMPVLFLVAMGVGLGGLVDDRPGAAAGLSYLHFVTPGLMVAASVQQAAGESLWPVLGGIKWDGRYVAMVASPLTPVDVFAGVLAWIAIRVAASTVAFLLVATVLGGVVSPWGVLALPATVLCSLAFAAPTSAFSITQENEVPFAMIMRLGVLPLFLFSGTFFPVSNLPGALQPLAWLSPLWHGVELARHATTGDAHWADLAHLAILLAWVTGGWLWGLRTFPRRLTP
ncbi:MAG: type transporter [Acidimicrobiales bacterium]|nr:type transporter [Acidimicrobiales bacterium]